MAAKKQQIIRTEDHMPTEREKMVAGELYNPLDPELVHGRRRARDLLVEINSTRDADVERRRALFADLFAECGDGLLIEPPFFCDYGFNISVGNRVFMNFNCVILDVAPVDRKSTRLNSSHVKISYAVFCLKKKTS